MRLMSFVRLSMAFVLLALASPTQAADVQYPPGSRLGR